MKGRKPQDGAIRRGLKDSYGLAIAEGAGGLSMPDDIAQDPVQSEIWAWIVPPDNTFVDQDMPTLRLLCYWHAVAIQAQKAMSRPGGGLNILDRVGTVAPMVEGGEPLPLMRKNPVIQVLKEASSEIRALSDILGLSPLARSRIGVIDAAKTKTAAETAAIFKRLSSEYELPEVVVEDAQD